MNLYATLKDIHVASAALSIAGFALRTGWMLWSPERLRRRWVKIAPHVVDSVLLASALALAWHLGIAGIRGWVPAKIVGLVVYIVLGTVALKRGRTRGVRIAAAIGAILVFAYIVSVAVTKSPLGFLAM